jgi:PPOX class probable F420-dependent enzyme
MLDALWLVGRQYVRVSIGANANYVSFMLDTAAKELAQGKNFAALTVIPKSGHPMTHVMWVDADDEHILINTELGRAKATAMDADPRVTVAIWNADNPYSYSEIRGTVVGTVVGQEAADHIHALSQKYTGGPYGFGPADKRIIYKIAPIRTRAQ